LKTSVQELPESRVRLEVEVPEEHVKHAIEHAASDLAGTMKIPGFRKGKVPLPVVVARVGRDALWQEAVRSHIEGWFWSAAATSGIRPVANPELEFGEQPGGDEAFRFSATVAVVPRPGLPNWTALEVAAPEPEVPVEDVDAEIDALRVTIAELVPVVDRPVRPGDTVVLDLAGKETHRDYVAEIGSDLLIEEIDEALVGMSPGETKAVELELADGGNESVEVTVKEIKEKVLPAADDELARAASEFDTLAELRADIEAHLREQLEAELAALFREAAVDALVAASTFDSKAMESLVEGRTRELVGGLVRSLERRGISVGTYLTATGLTQEQVITRMRAEADQSLRRELVLEAVAGQAGIDVADEEVERLIREQAQEAEEDPDEAVSHMREHGAFEQLRGDLRLKKALDEVVAGAKRIPVDLARAREKLWTPGKEKGPVETKIWTPGSEEER
jgi:trigger factor